MRQKWGGYYAVGFVLLTIAVLAPDDCSLLNASHSPEWLNVTI